MTAIADISPKLHYNNKRVLLVSDADQDTNKIIKAIKQFHKVHAPEYDKFAQQFWKGNVGDTTKGLFVFCKQNIKYKVEPEEVQTVKSPAAILHQRQGDCKHYSSFINGVCDSLNRQGYPIKAKYRFVADLPTREVHHVFAVVSDGKHDYHVDPVLPDYNSRPRYYNVKDADMGVYHISGTDGVGKLKIKNPFKQIAHGIKVNTANIAHGIKVNTANIQKEQKKVIKEVGKDVQKVATAVKNVTLKVGMAPARNSFLGLVDVNAFNLATKLNAAFNNPKESGGLKNLWKNIGGNPSQLQRSVSKNAHKKALLGVVQVAAMLALATAIIAAVGKYLHNTPAEDAAMANAAKDGAKHLITSASNGIDIANGDAGPGAAAALQTLTTPGGDNSTGSMQVSAGVDDDGNPQLTVHDLDTGSGSSDSGGSDTPADVTADTGIQAFNVNDNVIRPVEDFVKEHKMILLGGAGAIVAYKVFMSSPKKKRRR